MIFIAKLWGREQQVQSSGSQRVLCLHGYKDNCASFDRLIPLLDSGNTYLCINLPNHGRSSSTPFGVRWTLENYMLTVKLVIGHLQWSSFVCLGHSMGGQIAKLFTAVYPEYVEKLIMLDAAGPVQVYPNEIVPMLGQSIDKLLELENQMWTNSKSPPEYTQSEALARIKDRMYGPLDDESSKMLMARCLRPGGLQDKYHLANDARLSVTYSKMFSTIQFLDVVKNIKCPTLWVRASESNQFYNDGYKDFKDMYERNPNFRIAIAEGNHDVHMVYPHRVAPFIKKFLTINMSKL